MTYFALILVLDDEPLGILDTILNMSFKSFGISIGDQDVAGLTLGHLKEPFLDSIGTFFKIQAILKNRSGNLKVDIILLLIFIQRL